jgi:hypothetical protein
MKFLIIISLIIFLFFVVNSVIWLNNMKITNINDIIIKYIIYINLIIIILALLFIIYKY